MMRARWIGANRGGTEANPAGLKPATTRECRGSARRSPKVSMLAQGFRGRAT
jgi:hypothetical protein